jgi:hypothetical protein
MTGNLPVTMDRANVRQRDEPGKRSFFVIDPKGEIAAITANYRRKVCGENNVRTINPYGLLTDKRRERPAREESR